MAKAWVSPFADLGDKIAIPETIDPSGLISVQQGWGPDYELPDTNPSYRPVGRDEMNGVLYEITSSLGTVQRQGAADWDAAFGAYPKGAEVIHGGERWYSPVAGNTTEPGAIGTTWISAAALTAATTLVLGSIRLATLTEIRQGAAAIAAAVASLNDLKRHPGVAKAWANFNGQIAGVITPRGSFNISSITRNSTGDYSIAFIEPMADANYSVTGSRSDDGEATVGGVSLFPASLGGTNPTTAGFRIVVTDGTGKYDAEYTCVSVLGNS